MLDTTACSVIAQELTSELQQLYPNLAIEQHYRLVKISDSEESVLIFVLPDWLLVERRSRYKNLPSIFIDYADPDMFDQIQRVIEEYFGVNSL